MKSLKKIMSLVLAFNILLSVVGVTRYAHYCGGKLSSQTYFAKKSCCCGDEEGDEDCCCKNEVTIVQCKPDFIVSQNIVPVKPEMIACIFSVNSFLQDNLSYTSADFVSVIQKSKCDYHSPPLYLKHRTFII